MGNGSYERLERRFARIADLNAASRTVRWYSLTYGPPGGEAARGHQQATLGGLAHELLTAPECAEALAAARADEPWQAANLREMRRLHGAAAALPTDLVEAKARAVSRAQGVWHRTRHEGDFAAFLPALRDVVERVREEAGIRGEALGLAPYDALLDSYDPGRRNADVAAMFAELEAFLPGVIDRVRGGPKPPGPEGVAGGPGTPRPAADGHAGPGGAACQARRVGAPVLDRRTGRRAHHHPLFGAAGRGADGGAA